MTRHDSFEKAALKTALRDAFGAFATGVTVVTALDATGRPVGFTANSFTSVSLDPPLLLICLGKSSSNFAIFSQTARFAVNILAADQTDISQRFATPCADRFAGLDWQAGPGGAPLLPGVAAWFDCARHQVIDAGDHIVLLGRIDTFERAARDPLIYLQGRYLEPPAPGHPEAPRPGGSIRAGAILGCGDAVLMHRAGPGWSLPISAPCAGFREARLDLEHRLDRLGVGVHWNVLYSVFDDPEETGTRVFFHGQIAGPVPRRDDLRLFALDALPLDRVATRQMRSMLRRYAAEAKSDSFGVYVDAAREIGHVARLAGGAPTPWQAPAETAPQDTTPDRASPEDKDQSR